MFNNIRSIFGNDQESYEHPDFGFHHGQPSNYGSGFDMSSLGQALGGLFHQHEAPTYSYPPQASHSYGPSSWGNTHEGSFGSIEDTYYGREESSGFFSGLSNLFGIPASSEDSMYQDHHSHGSQQSLYGGEYSNAHQSSYGSEYSNAHQSSYGSEYSNAHQSSYGSGYSNAHQSSYGGEHSNAHQSSYGSEYSNVHQSSYGSEYSNAHQSSYGGEHSNAHQSSYGGEHSEFYQSFYRDHQPSDFDSGYHTHSNDEQVPTYGHTLSPELEPYASILAQSRERPSVDDVRPVERLDVKEATPSQFKEWQEITQNVIQLVDDHSIPKNAMKNLFVLYVASPTFRETIDRLRGCGPVYVRTTNAEEARIFPTAARVVSVEENINTVVLNPDDTYDPNMALAALAFELTNVYFYQEYNELEEQAPTMTAREYGVAAELVELNTVNRVHEYQMEARRLLKKYGFKDPRPWMTSRMYFLHPKVQDVLAMVGIRGKLTPMFKNKKKLLSIQRDTGHTQLYENFHRAKFPQANDE